MSLHALVEKWRDLADDWLVAHGGPVAIARWTALKECSDDLRAALAGGGEPVAWMDQCKVCNGSDSAGWGHGCEPGGCSTAPARDERDLFKEHFKHFDCTEQRDAWGNRQFIHEHVESIFFGWKERAALNPGGSRDHD